MNKVTRVISLGILLTPFCASTEPSQRALEFVDLMDFGEYQHGDGLLPVEDWEEISEEEKERFERNADYTVSLLEENLAIWVDNEFTEDELKRMLDFFQSDSGEVFIKVFFGEGEMLQETEEIADEWSSGRVREMHAFIQSKELEE